VSIQKNNDAKNKKRQDEMQKKHGNDKTVIIEVVQVVVQMDKNGKKKGQRFAMSEMKANEGKKETKKCQSEYIPSVNSHLLTLPAARSWIANNHLQQ
jgi:hypothetical protein